MRKFIRNPVISLFEFIVLRITSGASPSLCTSTGKSIRSLAISLFEFVVLRITSGASPSLCTTTRKFIRSLAISSFGILLLRIKGRASPSLCISMRKFIRSLEISLFQNSHSAYKEKGRLRPHAPRWGNLYAASRFPSSRKKVRHCLDLTLVFVRQLLHTMF